MNVRHVDLDQLARCVRMLGLLPSEDPHAAIFNEALTCAAAYLRGFIGREQFLPIRNPAAEGCSGVGRPSCTATECMFGINANLQPKAGTCAFVAEEPEPDWFPNEGDRHWWREQHDEGAQLKAAEPCTGCALCGRGFLGSGKSPAAWQPMETVPKDGRRLLVFVPRLNGVRVARWLCETAASPCWWAVDSGYRVEPSHWVQMLSFPPAESRP
jgi:hypothetical protein